MVSAAHRASNVEAIIFDVDGVLTDGGLYRADDGQELKRFHARDGLGMRMLADSGVQIAVITGRTSEVVAHRCRELRIEHVYQGQTDKLTAFNSLWTSTRTGGNGAAREACELLLKSKGLYGDAVARFMK